MALSLLERFRKPKQETYVFQKKSFRVFDHFTSSKGDNIPLLEGFRDHLKPSWRSMTEPSEIRFTPLSKDQLDGKVRTGMKRISSIGNLLDLHGFSVKGGSVLEIGCSNGGTSICASMLGPKVIIGSDMSEYFINQSAGQTVSEENKKRVFEKLTQERDQIRDHMSSNALLPFSPKIDFVEDDINNSIFSDNSFDLVFGIEVMEHVMHPLKALKQMHRITRPHGFVFQEYNPFFCIEGGHSLCTLDFPWGHARLSADDFIKYTSMYRLNEAAVDQSFYLNNLNRMSLSDIDGYINEAGFKTVEFITWTDDLVQEALKIPNIISQIRQINETATIQDLITDRVWLLLEKI